MGLRTHKAFEAGLFQLDRSTPVATTVGVRYGSVGDLSFSIGYGPRQETLSQFDTPELSHGGAHTYELYFMAEPNSARSGSRSTILRPAPVKDEEWAWQLPHHR